MRKYAGRGPFFPRRAADRTYEATVLGACEYLGAQPAISCKPAFPRSPGLLVAAAGANFRNAMPIKFVEYNGCGDIL